MPLRAGLPQQAEPAVFGRGDVQRGVHPVAGGDPRVPLAPLFHDPADGHAAETADHRRRVGRDRQDVDGAGHRLPPAQVAGRLRADEAFAARQVADQLQGDGPGPEDRHPRLFPPVALPVDGLEDLLLGRLAEAADLADAVGLRRPAEVLDGLRPQSAMDFQRGPAPDAGHLNDFVELRGDFFF